MFTIVSADNDCFGLLHANIARYFYFLVTKGNLTLFSLLVPTRCLLSLVSNGNLILLSFI